MRLTLFCGTSRYVSEGGVHDDTLGSSLASNQFNHDHYRESFPKCHTFQSSRFPPRSLWLVLEWCEYVVNLRSKGHKEMTT